MFLPLTWNSVTGFLNSIECMHSAFPVSPCRHIRPAIFFFFLLEGSCNKAAGQQCNFHSHILYMRLWSHKYSDFVFGKIVPQRIFWPFSQKITHGIFPVSWSWLKRHSIMFPTIIMNPLQLNTSFLHVSADGIGVRI